ncbi:pre-mRNA-splicing factor CWC25 homolog isoform X1 [Schistocerca serialis cubense]|uniref:pre-mRNA-splicing factor CWC25 homolog isoform X1 n=1 Tax=Schistocerca serialis cubense TaxID=2023355 RepID=UPI00214F5362|nr:pre-mRNA-splicing factor CWC25 homolog isoform X1 [Schistocerca serialis cubense]
MGGGDLNLKKSWHPSTTRNIEKVWKAEQRHDEEQKRINDLRREIIAEKDKEDIKKYAEEKGVIEKKNEHKLEWMYKKPGELVDREEYLLGRSIDKTFEQIQESEKAAASSSSVVDINLAEKAGGEHSSFASLLAPQVDLARKLQEDPLFAIRKKELETRSHILKNPVKLKKLQQLLSSRSSSKPKKLKKEKKKKKKRKKNSDSEDSDSDIDAVLLDKYKKLKEKLKETDLAVLKTICVDTDKDKKLSSKPKNSKKRKHDTSSMDEEDYHQKKDRHQDRDRTEHNNPKTDSRNQHKPTYTDKYKADRNWKKPEKKKLTEEEIERRRAEMLDNAKWREQERDKNIARNKAQEEYEKKQMKDFDKDFIRKQLSIAASQETVEGRIRSNMNNIQRSGMAMDKNFARR